MAACENCSTGGFQPNQMHANKDGTRLLGPCCQDSNAQIDWGVSLSSKNGLFAFAEYADLKLTFRKTFAELKELVSEIR